MPSSAQALAMPIVFERSRMRENLSRLYKVGLPLAMALVYRLLCKNSSHAHFAGKVCKKGSAFPVELVYIDAFTREDVMTDSDLLAQKKERLERDQSEVQLRMCLMCSRKFMSSWKGNRICRRCRHLESDFSVEGPAYRAYQHITTPDKRGQRNEEIIRLRRTGVPTKVIAERFKMGESTVRDIVRKT